MAFIKERHRPRKRYGQHFLNNENIADRIVESAAVGSGDTVLEIGPGKGILTGRILKRARAVYAVEIDRDLTAILRERFKGEQGFHLIEADILTQDLIELFRDVSSRIKVVSNIPYNISSPIIELLIRSRTVVSAAVLMVQKEVARRLLAGPGSKDYGLTTLNLALCAEAGKVMDVKPGAFSPPPEVMSSVISVVFSESYRYPLNDEKIFRVITGVAFRQRRKMLRNTLIPYFISRGLDKSKAVEILPAANVDPQARPESVDVAGFVKICNEFVKMCPGSYPNPNKPEPNRNNI